MRHLDPNNQHPVHSAAWTKANEDYAAEVFRRTGERPGCFPAGTPVRTPWGERAIESLAVGDAVLARGADGDLGARRVHRTPPAIRARVRRLHWTSGARPLATTRHHAFHTTRGWVRCDDLRPGDRVLRPGGGGLGRGVDWSAIERVEDGAGLDLVFNLIVEHDLNYVAGGCLVHCFGYWRWVRTRLHRLELLVGRGLARTGRSAHAVDPIPRAPRPLSGSRLPFTLTHQLPAL